MTLSARRRRAREVDRAVEPKPAVPAQEAGVATDLPYTSGFVGQRSTVDRLTDLVRTEHSVALVGRRGVGTSACVVQAANEVRDRFRDAPLYLDLRRTDRRGSGRALRPREVVAALCRTAGIDEATLARTPDLDAAAALLRTGLGDREVLLVIDNVDSPEQVAPLLPPAARCRLLLSGGPALSTLDGVRILPLAEPTVEDAAEMFATAARDAGSARRDLWHEPTVTEIVELAGRQPHAIRVLGSWMARLGWSPDELLSGLRRGIGHGRTDAPLSLLAGRDRAYTALGAGTRRMVRLLALVREPLSRNAIAALTGARRGRTDRMLEEAEAAAFVTVTPDRRYRLRPLLLGYTRIHLACDEPPRRRVAAQTRLLGYLARRAERYAKTAVPEWPLSDELGGWFHRHGELLRTLVCEPWGQYGARPEQPPPHPPRRLRRRWLRLAVALCTWYASAGQLDDWAAVSRAVLYSSTARTDASLRGWAHHELGTVRRRQDDPRDAAVELRAAVGLRRRRGAAQSRTHLGLALLDQSEIDGALDQLQRARRRRLPRDRADQALTELGLGAVFLAREEPRIARHHLVLAANRFMAVGDRRGYTAALINLALAQWWLDRRGDAEQAWSAALDGDWVSKYLRGRAARMIAAGAIVVDGDHSERHGLRARHLLRESLRRAGGRPVGRTMLYLGDVADVLEEPGEAKRCWATAVEACEQAGDAAGATAARARLGTPL